MGGQNCFFESDGAYTGAVSTCMLQDVGVKYVLCGHSERRCVFKDDDTAIARKVKKVIKQGMTAVLCFGETQEEYEVSQLFTFFSAFVKSFTCFTSTGWIKSRSLRNSTFERFISSFP